MRRSSDLAAQTREGGELVKLRFFAGLTIEQAAAALRHLTRNCRSHMGLRHGLAASRMARDSRPPSRPVDELFEKSSRIFARILRADRALYIEATAAEPHRWTDAKPDDPKKLSSRSLVEIRRPKLRGIPRAGLRRRSRTLRARVEQLLAAHRDAADSFLGRQPIGAVARHHRLSRPSSNSPAPRSVPTSCWSRLAKAAWASCTWRRSGSPSAARWP